MKGGGRQFESEPVSSIVEVRPTPRGEKTKPEKSKRASLDARIQLGVDPIIDENSVCEHGHGKKATSRQREEIPGQAERPVVYSHAP